MYLWGRALLLRNRAELHHPRPNVAQFFGVTKNWFLGTSVPTF